MQIEGYYRTIYGYRCGQRKDTQLLDREELTGILSSQPENRRQIFEEAAGIVKYKSRKQESERKLESVQENIIRINDILRGN